MFPRTFLCTKCGKFHPVVCEDGPFGRTANDEEVAALRASLVESAARDSEWRSRLDVVEGRLKVARLALGDLAGRAKQAYEVRNSTFSGKVIDAGMVEIIASRALTETASTPVVPSPGAAPIPGKG